MPGISNWGESNIPEGKIIVLTAPHAKCKVPSYGERTCDLLAGPAVWALFEKLGELKVPTELFYPNITRSECDLNRYWCRDTEFRQQLTEFLKANVDNIGALFDIHSFPANTPVYNLGDVTPLYDVNTEGDKILTAILVHELEKYGVKTNLLQGSQLNDIVVQATDEFNIPSILIEFKESMKKDKPEEFKKAIDAIAAVAKLYSTEKESE